MAEHMAARRGAILQPANLGQASRLPIPFSGVTDRAHAGKARISDLDPDEGIFHLSQNGCAGERTIAIRTDTTVTVLDHGLIALAAKFLGK
jgi:hypothetical protein